MGNRVRTRVLVVREIKQRATFVIDADIERSEELRPDRLGPTQDDVENPEIIRPGWAPVKTLGPP
jgi:hypothetical protein